MMDENESSKESKPSTDVITSLEDKIAYNIFTRLPPKEICYFKTLSKKWNEMLSDPSFKNLYREKSNESYLKLFTASYSDVGDPETGENFEEFISMSLSDYEDGTIHYAGVTRKIDESILRMLYAANGNLTCFFNDEGFFIFNPTSKRFANLPETTSAVFKVLSVPGFGYVPSTNEYIFVHMFDAGQNDCDAYDTRCEWLTLSEADEEKDISTSPSWRVLEKPLPYPLQGYGVLVDGLFYFVISDSINHSAGQIILSVDLENESFKIIGHPDETVYDETNRRFLQNLNGQLCFVDILADSLTVDIWLLTDPEITVQWMKWTKLCSVDLRMLNGFNGDVSDINLLGLRNGELIFQYSKEEKLDYYNIEEETSREGTVKFPHFGETCLYTQSLSFLNLSSS